MSRIYQRWFIFDFGGGTLDVALIGIGYKFIEVLAIDGDNHLGGQDIDHSLMERYIEQFIEEYREDNDGKDPKITPRIQARFKQAACNLKEQLSGEEEGYFSVDFPDFYVESVTR